MEGKVHLLYFIALVASSKAASISGTANIDPTQAFAGGQIKFPRIPGINQGSDGSPFGPFTPFVHQIPGLSLLTSFGGRNLPGFPNIDDLISKIRRNSSGNGASNNNGMMVVPPIPPLPSLNAGSNIPGLSEAIDEARKHLKAALNITSDLSTGLSDAVETALNGDNPQESIHIILDTIAKVYSTVAANCPLIIVGSRVFDEGVRLCFEVAKSIGNVVLGPENNRLN